MSIRPSIRLLRSLCVLTVATAGACTVRRVDPVDSNHRHDEAGTAAGVVATRGTEQEVSIPAGSKDVAARLASSPRHGEYQMIRLGPSDSVLSWVVYPQRRTNAPVVLVIHEIFGLSTWARGVADQLAADGYIAVAPDLLTGRVQHTQGDTTAAADAQRVINTISPEDHQRHIEAVAAWAVSLPSAQKKYGIVGYCWGGSASFTHALLSPKGLSASVVYYGSISRAQLPQVANVKVPVLGLYGGTDQRIGATIPYTDSAMKANGKTYEPHTFDGAAHGFLRAQVNTDGTPNEANIRAAEQAWPLTIGWFHKYLGT
jgi:carboxymethylenebutenolidase